MDKFIDTQFQYKTDDFKKPLYARVCCEKDDERKPQPKPIVCSHSHACGWSGGRQLSNDSQLTNHVSDVSHCIVVIPNYRLAPQVSATTSFADVDSAYDWSVSTLPSLLSKFDVAVDTQRIAAYGHSIGGTMALHLASHGVDWIKVAASMYPCLYMSDKESTSFRPYAKPPFGALPDFEPTEEDWTTISPKAHQVSETGLLVPGAIPAARNKWQATLIKKGILTSTVQPDGNYAAIDPTTKFKKMGASWPPTILVSPSDDDIPGCGEEYIYKAVDDLKAAGAKQVKAVSVANATHMFDIAPTVGTSDLGPKYMAVKAALDFVIRRL
ncbi:hypothetical protein MBLNU457_7037t3 [Dothideomycetes sp. NU457]